MPKKLLLAEDSLTIRKVFELALSRSDIAITAVDNGEDAVRFASEIFPDLVVADLTLPGKNGFAVAAELRAMEKTREIPVLILSGTLDPPDAALFKASGAKGVLFKPFEAKELLDTIERLLHEATAVPEPPKPLEVPAADERWDFSDILDEVEAEEAKSPASAQAPPEELLPGAILPVGIKVPPPLNEFDVSVDEIEGSPPDVPTAPPVPPATVEHIESGLFEDAPPPVTDLSPALDAEEGTGNIEPPEEVEAPASIRIPSPEASLPEPSAPSIAPPGTGSRQDDAELREFFAGRAGEIFRTVASEAVEKVMWEMTDRLAAEFSEKLRESVEAVAWEVIPSTAEALIREEIARIRGKAGKPSP